MEDPKLLSEQFETGKEIPTLIQKRKNKEHKKSINPIYIVVFLTMIGFLGLMTIFLIKNKKVKLVEPLLSGEEKKPKSDKVLVVDIIRRWGAICRFRLFELSEDKNIQSKEIATNIMIPNNYWTVEDMLKTFLEPFKSTENYPAYAIISIPGTIRHNTIVERVPEISKWQRSNGDEIAKKLKLKKVILVNDFVTKGYGIQSNLKEGEDFIVLNNKPINNKDKKLVIGPGTGLGVCYLAKGEEDEEYKVYESEGSNQDFAAKDMTQFNYKEYLSNYFGVEIVTAEKACSGPSLIPLYKYLKPIIASESGIEVNPQLESMINNVDKSTPTDSVKMVDRALVEKGISGECKMARKVLEYFVELLGNFAGNLGMYSLPYGGIYIVGSLSANMKEIFQSDIFQKALLSRGELNFLLKDVPIVLVLNEDLGMIGAEEIARRLIAKS